MKPITWGLILLALMLLCIVTVAIYRCREMREDWTDQQPPRFRDYFWNVFESILVFFLIPSPDIPGYYFMRNFVRTFAGIFVRLSYKNIYSLSCKEVSHDQRL